jgi:hypothetical protein
VQPTKHITKKKKKKLACRVIRSDVIVFFSANLCCKKSFGLKEANKHKKQAYNLPPKILVFALTPSLFAPSATPATKSYLNSAW